MTNARQQGGLIDISQTIQPGMPVWPGDTPVDYVTTWALNEQCPVNVSKMTLSSHTGTHADAPSHYDAQGKTVDQVDLNHYLGKCWVVHAVVEHDTIQAEDILQRLPQPCPQRVLIRTYQRNPVERWDGQFKAIAAEAIAALAKLGVRLVGTDTPSLDPETSKELRAHQAIKRHNMAILEGLLLDDVAEGAYTLIALPMKLAGLDASPVRAVLLPTQFFEE